MHVYIGGAYNGKSDYVKKQLALAGREMTWYDGELPPKGISPIVVNNLHQWLAQFEGEEAEAIELWTERLSNRACIVILTDIGRGIVPMDAKSRAYRDRCGRLYQALIAQAEEVTQIWYGIAKKIL